MPHNDASPAKKEQNLLVVEYGSADIFTVPLEGSYATVYYHDEAYGDVTDVDEDAIMTVAAASSFANVSVQSGEDDLNDSVDTPGYEDLGDDYGTLNYGNEVIHVANVIGGLDQKYDPANPVPPDPATKPAPKATGTPMAKTGDALGGLGGVLSAAALAGTAFAAYSARRVANEKHKAQKD